VQHLVATQRVHTKWSRESTNVGWYVVALVGDDQIAITRQLRTRDEATLVARTLEEHLGLAQSAAFDDSA
jgi:hypothetical protein